MHEEIGQHRVDVFKRSGTVERFLDHHPRAESDRLPNGLLRDRAVATADQRIVQSVGKIRRGIDKRAVEIENDGHILKIGARHLSSSLGFYVDRGRLPRHISPLAFEG